MKIAVVGIWHLGEVVSTCLAELGHQVVGFDFDQQKIDNLNKGILPLDETSLKDLLDKNISAGNLSFSTDFEKLRDCKSVFFTFDTPVDDDDRSDLTVLYDTAKKTASFIRDEALFVVMSQVPVGTTKDLLKTMKEVKPSLKCKAVYFPENLRLGQAVDCFLRPDRFVIGADGEEAHNKMEEILSNINCPRLQMGVESAEMVKHALNSFLATSLSFAYNISDVCEKVGADMADVSRALKSDERIGPGAYLDTSLGFSGGTLMRDLKTLSSLGEKSDHPLSVINGVINTNENRMSRVVREFEKKFSLPTDQLKIGVLGITYKPGTPTLRRSMALEAIRLLQEDGVDVRVYDPGAEKQEFFELTEKELFTNPYEMAAGCHGLVFITAWPEFESLDFSKLKNVMSEPYIFFDTRNIFKSREGELKDIGLQYLGVGRA